MSEKTTVTEEEFDAFVEAYPRPIRRDVNGTCEPPLITYNDHSLGAWPECVVASCSAPYGPGDRRTGFKIRRD